MFARPFTRASNGSAREANPSPVVLAHEQPFRIGSAEFRPATREVLVNGVTSVIEPRVMQVLVALQRANGGVVSKDDLTSSCWDGRIVGEDAINRVVSRLRGVADKQAGGQFRVETITKVGYRLLPVNGSAAASAERGSEADGLAMGRREMLIGGSAIGIAVAAGIGWTMFERDRLPRDARLLLEDARSALLEGTVDQTSNAIGKLREAARLAPDSAQIWGLLAFAYMRQSRQAPSAQQADLRARGNAAVRRAMALEPGQPDALAANIVAMPVFRNWLAVERACRAALELHPEHPELNYGLANVMIQTGRTSEALEAIERVMSRAPMSPRLDTCRNVMLWDLGRFDEADAAMARSLGLWPRHYGVWFTNVYYRMYNGKAAEAAAMVASAATRPIGIPDWNFDLVELQANALASSNRAKIRKAVEASLQSAHRGTGFAENAAMFAGFVGDFDTAFGVYDALYFNRGFSVPEAYFSKEQGMYSGGDRHTYNLFRLPLTALQQDRRFAALTRAIGLDDYWARTNSRPLVTS